MFRKLRIRFTCSTLVILVVFLSFLSSTVYFATSQLIDRSSKSLLEETAKRIISSESNIFDDSIHPNFFDERKVMDKFKGMFSVNDSKLRLGYVIYDQMLDPVYVKNNDDIHFSEFEKYVFDAYEKREKIFSSDKIEGVEYRIYTMFFYNGGKTGVVQLYQDISMEIFILEHLKHSLFFLIVVSSFILAVISWYLAGKSIKPVMESWNKQKEFIADASHELRTPLTVIQTNLDAAMCDDCSTIAENKMWLDNAYSETEVMAKLVEELLMLAKIDANQVTLKSEDMDFTYICNKTMDKFAEKFKIRGISVHKNLEEGVMISGDQWKLTQMLSIITDNAIKYTDDSGEYSINLKKEKNNAVLEISDSGVGISEEDIERIFDRFYRADKSRNREEGGTGLGLSIAKWIIESHKGTISVVSKVNEGTTFTVELPIKS
jgi:signal transduction histidine kinase